MKDNPDSYKANQNILGRSPNIIETKTFEIQSASPSPGTDVAKLLSSTKDYETMRTNASINDDNIIEKFPINDEE